MTEPLPLIALPDWLPLQEREDPDVLEFLQRSARATAEEKPSSPADWTPAQNQAMDRGDWREFSRLRGYSDSEISNFARYIELVGILDRRYGEDYSVSLDYNVFGPSL